MIRTKFSSKGFYWPCIMLILAIVAGVFIVVWSSIVGFAGNNRDSNFMAGCLGVALVVFVICLSSFLQKGVYKAELDVESIRLRGLFSGQRVIWRGDIRSIDLFARGDFAFEEYEALSIELDGGSRIKLADPYYRNMPVIKEFLLDNYGDRLKPVPVFTQNKDRGPISEKFSGNPLCTFPLLAIILFFAVFFFAFVSKLAENSRSANWQFTLVLAFPFLILHLVGSTTFYYFGLNTEGLVIRNHFKPWYKKTYPFTEIAGVVFESHYRGPIRCLRVRTRDFHSKLYPADSLRKSTWLRFFKELEKSGILITKAASCK